MIRAVLVDDEPPARVRMRQLLDAVGGVTVVGEAGNAADATTLIRDTRPDVVFLDVEMPEVRGTALAASLPEPRPFIVFATAFDNYGLDAIAVEATDYLLKPVSRAKLATTLDRVRTRLARLSVDRDVVAAAAVQSQMWPGSLPRIPGFDCAAASLAARGVGGDFYDAFPIGGTAWALLLGDASGKGIAAGLVAAAVQARVNTAARMANLDPEELMAAIDRDVFATTDGARYATAIYAQLDAATSRLTIVNAGHPSPFVVPSGRLLTTTGPALGLIEAGTFGSHSLTLTPGSVFVAYTDGVNEACNATDEEFGEARLMELVTAGRDRSAVDICAMVLDAVRVHRGLVQDQDDMTVMVVKKA
ncbi:MAG TPA: SpoIIE family protein phosphatase [Vicinamibacterales bacterium]|nr:SpoIIE family protein phosphatase [Vicinamibacterales bacterium]